MVHKVIANQLQILHEQERKIMTLGQQLDKCVKAADLVRCVAQRA